MGFFSAHRKAQRLGYYQMPDKNNPLSWGAVRENIETASNRDFLKHSRGAGSISSIQKMFLKRPSTHTGPIERPGFLQGLKDTWIGK